MCILENSTGWFHFSCMVGHALASLWSQGEPVRAQSSLGASRSFCSFLLQVSIFVYFWRNRMRDAVERMKLYPELCRCFNVNYHWNVSVWCTVTFCLFFPSCLGMVTHNWSNLFHHLIAAIFADALEKEYYAGCLGHCDIGSWISISASKDQRI